MDTLMSKRKTRASAPEQARPLKGIHSRVSPQELRWGDIDLRETENQHAKCELYLAQIGRLLIHAKSMKRASLRMDGYTHLFKATEFLKKFASNLQEAMNEAQHEAALEARKSKRD
jgi:hypothetical protein